MASTYFRLFVTGREKEREEKRRIRSRQFLGISYGALSIVEAFAFGSRTEYVQGGRRWVLILTNLWGNKKNV